ncbi:2-hydroxyacid dehydrogenase [archaeon]|nr:MAG: 2-hydroxyacid dehydrogenase [archaeon]
MDTIIFSAKRYDQRFLTAANADAGHSLLFVDVKLDRFTASLAKGQQAVSLFVNDRADKEALEVLADGGVKLIALRSCGYNHVDLEVAKALGISVTHVPDYSPYAVSEHTLALCLSLVRRIPQAHLRVRGGNFSIDGLLGFNLNGKVVGLVGVGKIGIAVAKAFQGFGCQVIAYDPMPTREGLEANVQFLGLQEVIRSSDVLSLHCPLNRHTKHMINYQTLSWMKKGAVLLNTSRGGLVDTRAVLEVLESGHLGALGIDVYEDEAPLFYEDHSSRGVVDEVFRKLVLYPNVLVTGHQGFFTEEAMKTIASRTIQSFTTFASKEPYPFTLVPPSYENV